MSENVGEEKQQRLLRKKKDSSKNLDIRIYRIVPRSIEKTSVYSSDQILFKIRLVFLVVITAHCFFPFFTQSVATWFQALIELSCLMEFVTFFYFFTLLMLNPVGKAATKALTVIQLLAVNVGSVVFLMFWIGVAPSDGFGPDFLTAYTSIFRNTFPFLFILHDCLTSYGRFTMTTIYISMVAIGIYMYLNLMKAMVSTIVIYSINMTDPDSWISYIFILVLLIIVYVVGMTVVYFKRKITLADFKKKEPGKVERLSSYRRKTKAEAGSEGVAVTVSETGGSVGAETKDEIEAELNLDHDTESDPEGNDEDDEDQGHV